MRLSRVDFMIIRELDRSGEGKEEEWFMDGWLTWLDSSMSALLCVLRPSSRFSKGKKERWRHLRSKERDLAAVC